jgi:NhaC family Na+:H+ antiporter
MSKEIKRPTLLQALIPIIILITILFVNIKIWKDDAISGPNQIALIFAAAVGGIIVTRLGVSFKRMRHYMIKTIGDAMPSILILLMIGALAGTWLISGIVPALIYYGLGILNPTTFLFITVIISAIVALATGSSWSTIATVGVALMGIGIALGFSPGMIAGAIISGAYFGDKMSPLSDTTNLAPAVAGTDLFTHIRYMMITTIPTLIITLIIFFIMGFVVSPESSIGNTNEIKQVIGEKFFISPILLLVPIGLIIIIIKKVPPIPALLAGAIGGGIFAVIFQPEIIQQLAPEGSSYAFASYFVVVQSMFGESQITTSSTAVNELLSSSGMSGMMPTIWLIVTAMAFSGVMESGRMLVRIAESVVQYAKSTGSLVLSTAVTSIFMNITASEQYISVVVPGRMYHRVFKKNGLKPEVLSRTLEDAGTVTSVLVPWNTCGAVNAGVLNVATVAYLPYAFFNLISPFMTTFVAFVGFKIRKYSDEEMKEVLEELNGIKKSE